MESLYYEDYVPGEGFRTLARTVTETDVVNFITLAGINEPLFMDQEYLRRETEFTGRLVPGLLTFSIGEGLFVQTGVLQGRAIAFLGMDELRFIRPVYVGDTIYVRVETKEKRHTRREDRGIVVARQVICNQRDEEVISCTLTRMVRRRPVGD
jgi:acyl dehydratase